ncbi:unnamed protein product [Ceutorhynchus assimilis]|uniref:Uncharacterized protein n=1 Tax=Ceutorhynchus assimilis TaxID=467358 RepID=A0A9N9QII7_9CUCU|nr:unnamed protein product [Ceutorhynchus assimilis]
MNCYSYNDKIKTDLFKQETTYKTDYKNYCDTKHEIPKPQRARSEKVSPPPAKYQPEDPETFYKFRKPVSFDLLLQPKPILQTNPNQSFVKLAPLPKDDQVLARKTRPRIYITPAVSIDDTPDPEMRRLLCNYMYTTEWHRAEIEGASNFKPKQPNIFEVEEKDTVTFKTELYPPLEERFIRPSKQWDDEQRRGTSEPTKEFWLHKEPPVVCGACVDPLENIVPQETKLQITKAIKDNSLRLAHDIPCASYAGYKPRMSTGVSISRKKLPISHPLLSTTQALVTTFDQGQDINK